MKTLCLQTECDTALFKGQKEKALGAEKKEYALIKSLIYTGIRRCA